MERTLNALRPFAGLTLAAALVFGAIAPAPVDAAPGGPLLDGSIFLRPRPIIAAMLSDGGIVHIGVMVAIEIPNKSLYDQARDVEPRLVDALVKELNAIVIGPWVRDNGVDHAVVKRRFLAVATRVLGQAIVKDVFVERSYKRRVS